jgi:cell division septum initiation protein DivIVA
MNDNSDLLPNLVHEDAFEMQMRGYSRRQVDEYIARCRSQIRDLEQRMARALDDGEELRHDLATARQQALGARPAHEEVSERIAQILKLADDEARSQKSKAHEDIARQRNDAQAEADKARAEAREQAERMLTAAQEQAERAITSARAEAEKTVTAARAEAEHTTSEANKKSESALASAKAQAKKALDEATARATAIHDGAERRLNLLSTRHSETIKRLTEILDGVSGLVAAETARMSLEDEVDQATAKSIAGSDAAAGPHGAAPNGPRPGNQASQANQGNQGGQASQGVQRGQGSPKLIATAAARPAVSPSPAPAPPQSSQPVQRTSAQPVQAADRRGQERANVIDDDEHTEGIRIVPGSDH